jgi:hypothetical protein
MRDVMVAELVKDPILLSLPESFESNRLLIRAPLWEDGVKVRGTEFM